MGLNRTSIHRVFINISLLSAGFGPLKQNNAIISGDLQYENGGGLRNFGDYFCRYDQCFMTAAVFSTTSL
jgi:hypothetical protein